MKIKLHRTDIPYRITKSSIQDSSQSLIPEIGSFNKQSSKKMSKKKIYETFILQYLVSFGLLTKGGLCIFAKRTKSNKSIKYFTVEVVSAPGKKISYTLDGVSDSVLGIAIRLTKLGANSFFYSVPFNQKSLPKDMRSSAHSNTVLSFFNMISACGRSKSVITYFDKPNKSREVTPAILFSQDGAITIVRKNKKPLKITNKKKALEWLLEHLNSYDVPTACLYNKNGMKRVLELSKKAELSSIPLTKTAVWEKGDRVKDFMEVFHRQSQVSLHRSGNNDFLTTLKSGTYFEKTLRKLKKKPTSLFLTFNLI